MLRPWDLQIVLERGGAIPAWQQIENAIIDAIRRGRLTPGAALPGTRDLAARIGRPGRATPDGGAAASTDR